MSDQFNIGFKPTDEGIMLEITNQVGVVKASATFSHPLDLDAFLMQVFMHGHTAFQKLYASQQEQQPAEPDAPIVQG